MQFLDDATDVYGPIGKALHDFERQDRNRETRDSIDYVGELGSIVEVALDEWYQLQQFLELNKRFHSKSPVSPHHVAKIKSEMGSGEMLMLMLSTSAIHANARRRLPHSIEKWFERSIVEARLKSTAVSATEQNYSDQITSLLRLTGILEAPGYYLSDTDAEEIMGADPMPLSFFKDMHLPHAECIIWLDQPMNLDNNFLVSADPVAKLARQRIFRRRDEAFADIPISEWSVALRGVWLESDKNGVLDPEVQLLVSEQSPRSKRNALSRSYADVEENVGSWTHMLNVDLSTDTKLRNLIVNLAGVVAFERWKVVDSETRPTDPAQTRSKSSIYPQKLRDLPFLQVRTLDDGLGAVSTRQPRIDDESEVAARRPGRHTRGAHWRRSQIGPREDPAGWIVHFVRRKVINPDLPFAKSNSLNKRVPTDLTHGHPDYFEGRVLPKHDDSLTHQTPRQQRRELGGDIQF